MSIFDKPAFSADQHIAQWAERGLAIPDRTKTEHYLSVISYYRLSAYTLPFQVGNPDHHFKSDTSFNDVLDLYVFDRELRLLVMDAIERIEVAIRSHINNHMAIKYGSHWYLDETHFKRTYNHKGLLADIERQCRRKTKEVFLKHYVEKYTSPRLPPSWVVVELLTYGQLSIVYDNMARATDQKIIARQFNTHAELLRSWMQSISYIRNVCAHHSRLWNRELGNAPKVPHTPPDNWIRTLGTVADSQINPNKRLYLLLVVIEYLLQAANPESEWHKRLYDLMQKHPNVSKAHMGMPEDWHEDSFWRLV